VTRGSGVLRTRSIIAAVIAVAVAIVVVILISSSSSPKHAPRLRTTSTSAQHAALPRTTTTSPQPPQYSTGFFAPDSIWNQAVPVNAPLDPHSAAVVGNLLQQQATEANGFGTGSPIYTVGPNQPTVRVTLDGVNPSSEPLQSAWNAVPIPADAQPSQGSDSYLVVHQPSSDTMWEFWKASHQADGWHAEWGGRMIDVSTSPGYYRDLVSPSGEVLEQDQWGAPATSLPLVGGMMTVDELRSGSINHALALLVHNTCANVFAAPAQRSDGNVKGDPTCVPEGAHFRLDPNLDLASLHLRHFVYMMAVAAQKYGIIIDDRTAGIGFRVEDPTHLVSKYGYNPYTGPEGHAGTPKALFDEAPYQMIPAFPWKHLQLLKMDLRARPDKTVTVVNPPSG
jgi:hypothetical protein